MRNTAEQLYPNLQKRMGTRIDVLQDDPALRELFLSLCIRNGECFEYPWSFGFQALWCKDECPFRDIREYGEAVTLLRQAERLRQVEN